MLPPRLLDRAPRVPRVLCASSVVRPWILAAASIAIAAILAVLAATPAWARALSSPAEEGPAQAPQPTPSQPTPSQPAPSQPAPPTVTLPVPKTNEGAVYPAQALAEGFTETVEVPLILTIDATGVVTNVVLDRSVGHGFDEAAVAAAHKLSFEPAARDGKPVAARTRFVYRFTPPPAVLSGRVVHLAGERPIAGASVVARDGAGQERSAITGPDGSWRMPDLPAGTYHVTVSAPRMASHDADETIRPGEETSAVDRLASAEAGDAGVVVAAADGGTEELEEVEVHGEKPPREVTKRTLERREIDRIPGTNGDALRSLQNLPGVGRPPALAGLLIVRGSAPQDTQYFIDGTPVPLVYHFGGLSSVVPTEMLDRIDFYPGNFSAQYGRATGGIVDVGLTDPTKDKVHGFAQVDLIDIRAMVQGPIFDTGWTFAIAGRRSWFDLWLGPVLTAAGAGVSVAPVYYDYQAILERKLDKRSSIRFAFFGTDRLEILLKTASANNPTLTGSVGSHTGFWRAQALYRNHLSDDTELRVVGAFGQDFFEFDLGNLDFNIVDWPISSRIELAQKLEKRLTLNVGVDMYYEPYTITAQAPPLPQPGQPPPGPFSTRPPLFTHSSDSIYEPAFYAESEATPWLGTRIVTGIRVDYTKDTKAWDISPRLVVRQDVTRNPRTTLKAGAGLFTEPPSPQQTNSVFGTPGLSSSRAYQYDVGVEREVTSHIEASLEGFYKQLDDLVSQGLGNTGSGVIYGAETLIRYKPDERFFGWLAYTLSRSTRRDAPGMPLRLSQFDETHILTVLGSYRLGKGWEFGARYRLTSGYMFTPNTYGYFDENSGTYASLQAEPTFSARLPLFHSLDLRVDKTWKYRWGSIAAYLDVLNVYNNGNVAGISYDYNSTHSSYASDLPILPSLGLRVEM
jgi:TonB family protein